MLKVRLNRLQKLWWASENLGAKWSDWVYWIFILISRQHLSIRINILKYLPYVLGHLGFFGAGAQQLKTKPLQYLYSAGNTNTGSPAPSRVGFRTIRERFRGYQRRIPVRKTSVGLGSNQRDPVTDIYLGHSYIDAVSQYLSRLSTEHSC